MERRGSKVAEATLAIRDSSPSSSKPFSCVVCHKRKVKCDRNQPCSNCTKGSVNCIYEPPPPPRRRKRKCDMVSRASQEREKSPQQTKRNRSLEGPTAKNLPSIGPGLAGSEPERSGSGPGMMIMREGNSIYLDEFVNSIPKMCKAKTDSGSNLWTSVSLELPDATEILDDEPDEGEDDASQDNTNDSIMLLNTSTKESLIEFHPNPLQIFRLWQTFLDNVNPLTKILHAPTIQQQILEAMGDLSRVGKDLEALMFSIYCISLVSLHATDVEKSFGESKKNFLFRLRRGARLALRNASFLRTSSTMVLQAFMLYLLSLRGFSDPHTIWTLSGTAVRIAQRIGIHRDGSGYGLSVFETEMRRRIWVQLMILDATSAQSCGMAAGPLPINADTKPPMNVNDSDLDPRMTELACEKDGPTEMFFCLARSEFGKWLRRWSQVSGSWQSSWAFLSSPSMALSEKDKAIDDLEGIMDQKFLKYCDISIPVHLATFLMARSAIAYTRLMAHHPRQYQEPNARIPQPEKDIIFESCFKMVEYTSCAQKNPEVRRFSWHMVNHMPWDAMIFMLSEMRHRLDREEKEKAWHMIGKIYARHLRQLDKHSRMPLHTAFQNLIVKAWKAYIEDCNDQGQTPTECPELVANLLVDSKGYTEAQPPEENTRISEQDTTPLPVQLGLDSSTTSLDLAAERIDFLLDSPMVWSEWDALMNQFQESLVDDMTLVPGPL
ncbi:hypothetical protein N7462_001682 [Penicillium macrosclerotiorum]|uniref:uncharacterized protein n=1 Tax=Penicillium macrosclerotiorum TaxID=303699 RepID=UPI0025469A9B|nr:uncharacterized protein N7462_001682 [Penicillium macrosclerotiorum]KAJ5692259.1 hypothetical protein N7462_001682 [Penicillium macrosclerotiorum]